MLDELELREVVEADAELVQQLLASQPDHAISVTGYPPGDSDALSLLLNRPPGLAEADKIVLAAWARDELVGVVDVLRHWPDPRTAHIGLLMVHDDHTGRGIATRMMQLLSATAARWDVERWRAGVVQTAPAVAGFWTSIGFEFTGEMKPWVYDQLETEVHIYNRPV